MRAVFRYLGGLVVATAALGGSWALAADADHGADLAKRWCAGCHLVDSSQKQASADVPPFATIARQSDFTPEKVAFFLLDPHPKMPNFPLSRKEAADIAAYIGSLRQYPRPGRNGRQSLPWPKSHPRNANPCRSMPTGISRTDDRRRGVTRWPVKDLPLD